MRTIGIDLAVAGQHKAIVVDDCGEFVSPLLKLSTLPSDLDGLLARARGDHPTAPLAAVMEPTGMAWFPIAVYLQRHDTQVYLVSSQQVADLRRFYKRHAKSDRIDARVLARLPLVNADNLHPLTPPAAAVLACQRACRQLDRLNKQITAIKNRLRDTDRFAWLGLTQGLFPETFGSAARWFRAHWYDPAQVRQAGVDAIRQAWLSDRDDLTDDGAWIQPLTDVAAKVLDLYGSEALYLDFQQLQSELAHDQEALRQLEKTRVAVMRKTLRPLYKQIHPSRNLETIKGVGLLGAAVYASFIQSPDRFPSCRQFRGWSGMVPNSKQSADSEAKGLRITLAGPNLVKKFAFLNAEVARQRDPQIAAVYYQQMVNLGKHHKQAICACATHLLNRVFAVLRDGKPYVLRDVDGREVTPEQARQIVLERYTVPPEIRKRNNKRTRRQRAEQRAEAQRKRESRPSR